LPKLIRSVVCDGILDFPFGRDKLPRHIYLLNDIRQARRVPRQTCPTTNFSFLLQ
jgi:hypothetical protein